MIKTAYDEKGIAYLLEATDSDAQFVCDAVNRHMAREVEEKSSECFCDFGKCPNCGKTVNDISSLNFCRHCGQAIDWSESNEISV